jgi:hypothetical protein
MIGCPGDLDVSPIEQGRAERPAGRYSTWQLM